jgi:hypothetical protein
MRNEEGAIGETGLSLRRSWRWENRGFLGQGSESSRNKKGASGWQQMNGTETGSILHGTAAGAKWTLAARPLLLG